jgi:dynein heavy chain, axonemal
VTTEREHEAEHEAAMVRMEAETIEKIKLEAEQELQAAAPALE